MNLVGWGELGGKVEGIDCGGVAQVVLKVLQGSLACDNSLDEESKHGEHSLQTYQSVLPTEDAKSETGQIAWKHHFNKKATLELCLPNGRS